MITIQTRRSPASRFSRTSAGRLFLLCALVLLGPTTPHVFALGEEEFGAKPVGPNPEWPEGLLTVANDPSRVYRSWVNGNENFYYSGDGKALNAFLAAYARVKLDTREVVLLPTAGLTKSFEGKPVSFAWRLQAPSGIYLHLALAEKETNVHVRKATLFIHVAGDVDLRRLEFPKGLSLLDSRDMVARAKRGAASPDDSIRGYAALLYLEHRETPEAVEGLLALLDDKEEYVASSAARALGFAGSRAEKVISALERRAKAEGTGEDLAKECRDAVLALEKVRARGEAEEAEEKRIAEASKAIRGLVDTRRKKT